jgi:hypothetical protein
VLYYYNVAEFRQDAIVQRYTTWYKLLSYRRILTIRYFMWFMIDNIVHKKKLKYMIALLMEW